MKIKHLPPSLVVVAVSGMVSLAHAAESETDLKAQAKITQTDAGKIAQEKVKDGKVKSVEIEKEHGRLVWSFDFTLPGSKNIEEVQVDAMTGKIAAVETETPAQQAAEAKEDAAASK